jgi:hypothetical protein
MPCLQYFELLLQPEMYVRHDSISKDVQDNIVNGAKDEERRRSDYDQVDACIGITSESRTTDGRQYLQEK